MPLFGRRCKHVVAYDGKSVELGGLDFFSKVTLGSATVKPEVLRAAAEIVQVFDVVQYSNCVKIEQLPKDSPERAKLILYAMDSERQVIQFAALSQALTKNPNSEVLQNALASWIASQAGPAEEASKSILPTKRRGVAPERALPRISDQIERAARVEPRLRSALANPVPPDVAKALEESEHR